MWVRARRPSPTSRPGAASLRKLTDCAHGSWRRSTEIGSWAASACSRFVTPSSAIISRRRPSGTTAAFISTTNRRETALLAEARALSERLDVDYLLIRTRGLELDGFRVDRRYRTAVIGLEGGADAVWKNRLDSKTHNQIRRGMKEGFTVETGLDKIAPFYDVFHEHMRDLGSPAHSIRFYESIVRNLGDRAEFFIVKDGRRLVAGALLFWTNGTAMNLHTVALKEFNRRCPNYLIYWKMIEAGCARGCSRFDMGRSTMDGPNLAFKLNWGADPIPLCYNYFLRKLQEIPHVDPRNPRYSIPIAIWRRLPVFVSSRLGPPLIAGLL